MAGIVTDMDMATAMETGMAMVTAGTMGAIAVATPGAETRVAAMEGAVAEGVVGAEATNLGAAFRSL